MTAPAAAPSPDGVGDGGARQRKVPLDMRGLCSTSEYEKAFEMTAGVRWLADLIETELERRRGTPGGRRPQLTVFGLMVALQILANRQNHKAHAVDVTKTVNAWTTHHFTPVRMPGGPRTTRTSRRTARRTSGSGGC